MMCDPGELELALSACPALLCSSPPIRLGFLGFGGADSGVTGRIWSVLLFNLCELPRRTDLGVHIQLIFEVFPLDFWSSPPGFWFRCAPGGYLAGGSRDVLAGDDH